MEGEAEETPFPRRVGARERNEWRREKDIVLDDADAPGVPLVVEDPAV